MCESDDRGADSRRVVNAFLLAYSKNLGYTRENSYYNLNRYIFHCKCRADPDSHKYYYNL